ncbi:MAG: DUF6062 family protein [Anaerolineae bacterium]|nr:DUF6062 family protein [Anaerolineae bacterium]
MERRRVIQGDERWFPTPADIIAYNLMEAMRQPPCPICGLMRRAEERFLFSLFWENVNSPHVRKRLRDSLGFCATHTRAVRQAVNHPWVGPLGIAILYRDFAQTVLEGVSRPAPLYARLFARENHRVLRLLSPTKPCWLCEQSEERERTYLGALVAGLDASPALRERYGVSHGLCLAHAERTIHTARSGEARRVIATAAARQAQRDNSDAIANLLLCQCGAADITASTRLEMQCPGCHAEAMAEQEFLQAITPEDLARIWLRLCPTHQGQATLWTLHRHGSEFAYDLVKQTLAASESEPYDCPMCDHAHNAAWAALETAGDEARERACLPHARLALETSTPPEARTWTAAIAARMGPLVRDLGELIRKHDYRFSDEPLGKEKDSWLRALVFFGGERVNG